MEAHPAVVSPTQLSCTAAVLTATKPYPQLQGMLRTWVLVR